jgi:hypothetical protein
MVVAAGETLACDPGALMKRRLGGAEGLDSSAICDKYPGIAAGLDDGVVS